MSQKRDVMMEGEVQVARPAVADLKVEESVCQRLQTDFRIQKDRGLLLPWVRQKERSPANTWIFTREAHFGLQISRTIREKKNCVVLRD